MRESLWRSKATNCAAHKIYQYSADGRDSIQDSGVNLITMTGSGRETVVERDGKIVHDSKAARIASDSQRTTLRQRTYLRLFAKRDGKKKPMPWVYERNKAEPFRQDPIAVAPRNNYYNLKTEDGKYDDTVEQSLGKVEADTLPVIRKLIDFQEPTWEDRDRLAFFVALQELRVPWARADFEHSEEKLLERTVRDKISVPGVVEEVMAKPTIEDKPFPDSISADQIREHARNGGDFGIFVDETRSLGQMLTLAPELARIYREMRWMLIKNTFRYAVSHI